MRSLELFAGAGGLGMGLQEAGFDPLAVIELDRYCCETIRQNRARKAVDVTSWPEPFEGDIKLFDFTCYENVVDLISGGPPCQPFSLGGKHQAQADQRDMFPEAVRAVREVRPLAFVFENVKGLTRPAFLNYYEYVKLQMEHPEVEARGEEDWTEHFGRLERHHSSGKRDGLQYRVLARVMNAANYGVAQRRERVFFVGIRDDIGIEWSFPEPSHSRDALVWDQSMGDYWERHSIASKDRFISTQYGARAKVVTEKPGELPWVTVRDAIGDLPDPESPDRSLANQLTDHRFQHGARSYPGHTGSLWDEPAKTLKAGVHGVPGGENMLRRSDGTVRYFTIRECARLQSFPDDFLFNGAWSEAVRQLGNAVPVKLSRILGGAIVQELRQFRG